MSSGAARLAKPRQRGLVIIMVMLIVAVVAGLGVKYAADYQLSFSRAESRWHMAQARAFLTGTEAVASLLFESADIDAQVDYIGEPWGNEVPIFDEGIEGYAKLTDATAQLNLNDLAGALNAEKAMGSPERYTEPQRRFIRLLQTFEELQISQHQAEGYLEAVIDWIDEDDMESGSYGAESGYYQGLVMPYHAANKMFTSVEELRMVRGFEENPVLVTRLMPFITVLPGIGIGLNINTVETHAPQLPGMVNEAFEQRRANNILRALGGVQSLVPLDDESVIQLFSERTETGYQDTAALAETWLRYMGEGNPLDVSGLQVRTEFFWLTAQVQMGDQRMSVRNLFQRADGNTIRVVSRSDLYEFPSVMGKKKKESRLFSPD